MKQKQLHSIMNKLYYVTIIWMIVMLVTCNPVKAQSKKDTIPQISLNNGVTDVQGIWNQYIDSVTSHLSIKQFQDWLFENATVKQYNDGKFVDFYNLYLQYRYNIWIAQWNEKHKKKP